MPLPLISRVVPELPESVIVRPPAISSVSLLPSATPPIVRVPLTVRSEVMAETILFVPLMVKLLRVLPPPTKFFVPDIVKVEVFAVTVPANVTFPATDGVELPMIKVEDPPKVKLLATVRAALASVTFPEPEVVRL